MPCERSYRPASADQPTLIFTNTVATTEALHAALVAAGIKAERTNKEVRDGVVCL